MLSFSRLVVIFILFFGLSFSLLGQEQRLISGVINDKTTGKAIPHATISLMRTHIGTISNEHGVFELQIPGHINNDTLLISYLGYQDIKLPLQQADKELALDMIPAAFNLEEFVVLPMPPTHYIKQAMRKLGENYPTHPFSSQSYYSEKSVENKHFLNHHEAVFQSFHPSVEDTSAHQHQLLLYRKREDIEKVQFMRDKLEKSQKKERKRAEKRGDEYEEEEWFDAEKMFGGPEDLLKSGKISTSYPFLDSTNFRKFDYDFTDYSSYQGRDLMVIEFKGKRFINKTRYSGKIYIDIETDAIVALSYHGSVKLPLAAEPVLFALGLDIQPPVFKSVKNFQMINGKWYPKNFQRYLRLNITKKYLFKQNESSRFEFKQILNVNNIDFENHKPIAEEVRFDPKNKDYPSQVHNDKGLSWKEINIMK